MFNSSDVAYFDGVNEIIITVGLVKPKVGVFQDFVHYLLVLATPSNIVVLGVTFSQSNESKFIILLINIFICKKIL